MKRYLNIIAIGVLCLGILSCKKTSFNYPDGTVGISKITYFPILTLKGNKVVLLSKGTAYTEAGVVATEAGAPIATVTTGQVNVSTAGVYTLTYTATNKDGFPASIARTVVVYDTQPDAVGNDFTGNYARNTNGELAVWTKLAPGVYSVRNPGGAVGASLTVIAFNNTGNRLYIPSQNASDGTPTSSSNESPYNPVTKAYSWVIINPGYGGALRTFIKQ
jgi:hypothetical protein